MTKAQRLGYFRRWNQACIAQGWIGMSKAANDAKRHAEQERALKGMKVSSTMLTNAQIDSVFAWFEVLAHTSKLDAAMQADLPPAGNDHPNRNRQHPEMFDPGRVRRWQWVILNQQIPALKRLGIESPVDYVEKICTNLFKTADLERLAPAEVHDLMGALNNRIRAKKKALGVAHEMPRQAESVEISVEAAADPF